MEQKNERVTYNEIEYTLFNPISTHFYTLFNPFSGHFYTLFNLCLKSKRVEQLTQLIM